MDGGNRVKNTYEYPAFIVLMCAPVHLFYFSILTLTERAIILWECILLILFMAFVVWVASALSPPYFTVTGTGDKSSFFRTPLTRLSKSLDISQTH